MPTTEWGDIVDPTEQVNTPDEAAAKIADLPSTLAKATASGAKQTAQHPLSTAGSVARFVKQNAIPTGAMGVVTGALDRYFPEGGIPLTIAELLAKATASGATNAALTKELPRSLGGEPEMPMGRSFLYGAAGEPLIEAPKLATKIAERRLNNAAVRGASEGAAALNDKSLAVQNNLLQGKQAVPFPHRLEGDILTAGTDAARDPVYQTIRATREQKGAWLNQAYTSLKGAAPVEDADLDAIKTDAQRVIQEAKAPGAQASRFANEMQGLGLSPDAPRIRASMVRQGFSPQEIENHFKYNDREPATLDQLRNLWQQLGVAKSKAEAANNGADANQLGQLRDVVEERLNDHLDPVKWGQERKNYRGFIRRWNYKDQSQLWNLDTPQQVADWTFEKPEYAHDLMVMAQGSPAAADKLRSLFLQHVYGPLNDTSMSGAEQLKDVQKRLAPYMKDANTAKLVLGPNAALKIRQLSSFARYSQDFTKSFNENPKFRAQVEKGVRDEIMNSGLPPAVAGQKVMATLAQADPQLEVTGGNIVQQLPLAATNGAVKHPGFGRMLAYHGTMLGMGLGGAVAGHAMGFGVMWQAASIASFLGADAIKTFGGASRLGITTSIIKAMGSGSPYYAGRIAARAFLNAGQREMQQMDVERNAS